MRPFIRSFLIAFSIVSALATTAVSETTRQSVTTKDGDYFGFDLRTEQNVSLEACEASCIGDQACRAFTYNPRVKWCFLKSDFNTLNSFPGAIAGKIVNASGDPDIGAAPELAFLPDEQKQEAENYRATLFIAPDQQNMGVDGLLGHARDMMTSGRIDLAIIAYKGALSITPDDSDLWMEMAAAANLSSDFASQAALAAINGYRLTRTTENRASALVTLARALEFSTSYRAALNAYKESLKILPSPTDEAAFLDLKSRQGFRIVKNTVDADTAAPRACVQFSEELVKSSVDYSMFVTLDGAPAKALEAKGNQICVEGLVHGQHYKLGLRADLPSSVDDEVLENKVDIAVYVKDRTPSVRFTGDSFVLPSTARRGVPIVSVNSTHAKLKLYRIGDRSIAALLTSSQFLTQIDGGSARRIREESGQLIWEGALDIAPDLNKEVVTSFPVDEALPQREPGVYVLVADSGEARTDDWNTKATQWFVVSDIGISTIAGTDGLNVFVRSLASAKSLAGIELQLLAKNNEILGTATTDGEGRATFTAGLIRGTDAMTPAVLTAKNASDYVFLDMTRAGFDLSDRGVTGRPAPGEVDIFAWTERGIYRPGEIVHAAALARDINAAATENLPLTFIFNRPDGVEDRRLVSTGGQLGGHAVDLALQANAMRGTWSMQLFIDPSGSPIGSASFLVDDFVPDRIEFDMASEAKEVVVGAPVAVNIDGRYLYGAPAAGLALEGEIALKPTREREDYKGFMFGLADEEMEEETRVELDELPLLDEKGKAVVNIDLAETPSTTQLLNADIVMRLREAGGRAVERRLVLPVQSGSPMIGIKPAFAGDAPENALAQFQVITIGPDGAKQAMTGLNWRLLAIERDYQWYREGNSWRYEPVSSSTKIAEGAIETTTDGATISAPVTWGRYRLEIDTADNDGPTTSVEFYAGWYVETTSTETPDALEIGLDKENYSIGDVAKLKISPRFAGEVLVTVGTETVIATKTASIGKDGGEIDLPVTSEWGAGAYVTVTLFRPGDAQESRMPMRAIGVKWLGVNPGERKLEVALGTVEKMGPRQKMQIPVQVTGAGVNEAAYVTIAAVDIGILNLTRYETPDPDGWYFGQRQLGLEIRDIYGRLIDGSLGATGRLRTGGDGGIAFGASPPSEKLVAFFAGPVKLDPDGKAVVSFDIPQFNGTVRVMAVAWSKAGIGHATSDVIVRDPVVVIASMPKFLAPGDAAELRIDLANTDGPAGEYQLNVTTNNVVGVSSIMASQTVRLETGGKLGVTLPLTASHTGDGVVTVSLSNGREIQLTQSLDIGVRPAALQVTERRLVSLAAGRSLTIDGQLLSDSLLQGASVSLNMTRAPEFDIPALLMTLDRYPYGCAEQTTSRALPLLYMSELSKQSGMAVDPEVKKRVQDAIYRVLSYQSSSGSFGLWSPGYGDLWLDAYISDFLTRAREQKYDVPEQAMVAALQNLQNALGYDMNVAERGNEMAYSLYVLARNRKAAISDLRYYADARLDEFTTPLAKAHIAAALGLYGDVERSATIFAGSVRMSSMLVNVSLTRSDYGSALRDNAAVLALAAESRPVPAVVDELVKIVAADWNRKAYTSTQEQTWMLLAARALEGENSNIRVDVNGTLKTGGYAARLSGDALLAEPMKVTNVTNEPVTAVITTVAAPAVPLPASGDGFGITRTYYTLDGAEANVSDARQNERYVVVLSVKETNNWPSRVVVTDLLPAGFEIDNPSIVNSAQMTNFEWVGNVETAHSEFRTDRFVAAFDRPAGVKQDISLAYVVRAVTPGNYVHPAASVEDMYRPQFSARTATGRMEVLAP